MTTSSVPKSTPSDAGDAATGKSVRSGVAGRLVIAERYALPLLLVAVCAFFSLDPATRDTFPTELNAREVLVNQVPVVIVALGLLFPLVSGAFDLSIGAVAGASAVVTTTMMARFGLPVAAAIAGGLLFGVIVGAVNGFLISRLELNAFIVTLGMNTLLTGLMTWYTHGNDISTGVSPALADFGSGQWLGITPVLYLAFILLVACWYVLGHTPFGRSVHAIGSNARAAGLVGINVRRATFTCFLTSGGLCGIAGVAMVAINAGAVLSEGPGLLWPALTAVLLGATTILPGRYSVAGLLIGVLFLAASVSGLTLSGQQNWVNDVFDGAALVVAVAVSTTLAKRRGRRG